MKWKMDGTQHDFLALNNDDDNNNNNSSATAPATAMTSNDDPETGNQRRRGRTSPTGRYFSPAPNDYGIALVESADQDASTNNGSNASKSASHPPKNISAQVSAFLTMSLPYFRCSSSGRRLFYLMILLTLTNSAIRVYFSYLARDFWNALSEKNVDRFYSIMVTFCIAMVGLTPISVAYRYVRQMLAISWREWLTLRVLGLFMRNRVYYSLERGCHGDTMGAAHNRGQSDTVDNPDQRIAEDVRSFTEFSLSLFHTTITSIIDLTCFSFILFSIMPRLFMAIFTFASVGTFLTICIGKRLISLNYDALQKEADFRFALVRIRENAESIAFYCGEGVERKETERRFGMVIDNMGEINRAERNLDFLTTSYNYLTWILPIIVTAPEYFAGNVEMGVISQASSAFGHILDDLSIVINSFTDVSKFSAGIDRLHSFLRAIQELEPDRSLESLLSDPKGEKEAMLNAEPVGNSPLKGAIRVTEYDAELTNHLSSRDSPPLTEQIQSPIILSIRGLRLLTPDNKRILVQNLDLSVIKGKNLLIAGASGSGKSSLLRAIAGLWSTGEGEIVRPNADYVYFLPQRPYCPPGSLRDQLLYPSSELVDDNIGMTSPPNQRRLARKEWSDYDLLNVLTSVDLPDLASRAGDGDPIRGLRSVLDWGNTLSLGEQQRLAFGRLVCNRPRLVIMDESTSALDVV
eukprot:CCRYP_017257-RC/>CCRYP_017257-RC protein AED:0.05 eAED:0.05 QI:104/1/1/1/1/1/4/481/690